MIGQKKCWSILCMTVLALTWLWTGAAYSQSSTNYIISRDVLDGGGGTAGSTNYRLTSSIGQASDSGTSSSDHYTNSAGFIDEGGGSGTAAQYVFTFAQQGAGSGTVTLDGGEIESGFTQVYDVGAELTLHAAPDADSVFSGWSGGCTGTEGCVVTIDSDKVVTAAFALKQYTIAASASDGGVIEPAGDVAVEHGTDKTFTVTPDEGCELVDVLVDSQSKGAIPEYTFTDVIAEHTIEASFAIKTFTITASAGAGGSIEPEGTLTVDYGANHTFTISPDAGYEIEAVMIDGVAVEELDTYTATEGETTITKATVTLTHVTADHTIEARFSEIVSGSSFLYDDWRDTDKSLSNPDDDWMCWAAAAANILDWAGWNTPLFDSAQDMFYAFQDYWSDKGSLMEYAWHWWFDGTEPPTEEGYSQIENPGGGNYWSDYNFFDYFYEDWATWDSSTELWTDGVNLMATIDEYLHNDYGVTLAVYAENGGHALTAWGYEYDDLGNYTGIWVTDSDDYITDLKLLSVSLIDELWYLDVNNLYGYNDWFIGGVQALQKLKETPIPEPGTLIFFGFGLIWLFALRRKGLKKK